MGKFGPLALVVLVIFLATSAAPAGGQGKKKVVAGRADVLRHVPKKFATYLGWEPDQRKVALHFEGDKAPVKFPLKADAEVRVLGWWGRIEQLRVGSRVWVWLDIDAKKKPRAILLIADEPSEQDIHDTPSVVKNVDRKGRRLTFETVYEKARVLIAPAGLELRSVKPGQKYYVQTRGEEIAELLTPKAFEAARLEQKEYLRRRWRKEGLPGTVSVLHPLGGEMEVMLDHESMRWGRYLKYGDAVSVADGKLKIRGEVRLVQPWRERTRVVIVTRSGLDQLELEVGQRVRLHVPEPPKTVQASPLPTDLGRRRGREERIEWFLASVYCTCAVPGDRCTGMYYSLASCNRNACGNPNLIRRHVGRMIDDGLSDRQIFERLLKDRGPLLLRPHLLK